MRRARSRACGESGIAYVPTLRTSRRRGGRSASRGWGQCWRMSGSCRTCTEKARDAGLWRGPRVGAEVRAECSRRSPIDAVEARTSPQYMSSTRRKSSATNGWIGTARMSSSLPGFEQGRAVACCMHSAAEEAQLRARGEQAAQAATGLTLRTSQVTLTGSVQSHSPRLML